MRIFVFVTFLLVTSLLPLISFDGYHIVRHTTSHLGSQGAPFAWVMNITFVLLGFMAILVTWRTKIWYHRVWGGVFGISFCFTGLFRHAPLVDGITTIVWQDTWHSIFATTTGIGFTLLAAGHTVMSRGAQRWVALIMTAVAIVIPIAMFGIPEIMGLLQRVMFISAFWWLFFYMKPPSELSV